MMTQEKQKKKNWFLKNAEKMNTKCKGKTEKKNIKAKIASGIQKWSFRNTK